MSPFDLSSAGMGSMEKPSYSAAGVSRWYGCTGSVAGGRYELTIILGEEKGNRRIDLGSDRMARLLVSVALAALAAVGVAQQDFVSNSTGFSGTWTSGSGGVLTGPVRLLPSPAHRAPPSVTPAFFRPLFVAARRAMDTRAGGEPALAGTSKRRGRSAEEERECD